MSDIAEGREEEGAQCAPVRVLEGHVPPQKRAGGQVAKGACPYIRPYVAKKRRVKTPQSGSTTSPHRRARRPTPVLFRACGAKRSICQAGAWPLSGWRPHSARRRAWNEHGRPVGFRPPVSGSVPRPCRSP